MKQFAILLVALVPFITCDMAEDDIKIARAFIKCIDKALDGGLPSIPIPNHNPLRIRDIEYNHSALLTDFKFTLTNNFLYNLLDYNFTKIEAYEYTEPERVAFDYDLYWPKLNFTGDFEFSLKSPLITEDINGTYTIILTEIDWTGVFNLTKRGHEDEGVKEHLDDFTVVSKVEDVSVSVSGVADELPIDEVIKLATLYIFNNFPAALATGIKDARFNDYWIDHPERIDAIIDNCKSSDY